MKKTVLFFISLYTIFHILYTPVLAQDFDFNKAYADYTFNRDVYDQSNSEYEKAKEFYLKNPTLTLKEEARKKTLTMLRARDDLQRIYLTALRMKINEVGGLTQSEKEGILAKLDSEVAWYQTHKESYSEADPLETLFVKSKESEERHKKPTTPIVYEALYLISLGQITGARLDHEVLYASIRGELEKNVSEGKLRIDPFNRWLTDIDGVIIDLKGEEEKSKLEIAKLYSQYYSNPANIFLTSVRNFEKSLEGLKKVNGFLNELLTSFNIALNTP